MKNRIATENEIKLATTEIINRLKEEAIGLYDYSDDDVLDDYKTIKNNMHAITIETPYGYNVINAIVLEPVEDEEINDVTNYTFISFNENKAYFFEGDFMRNNFTEEEYIKILEDEKEILKMETNINLLKYMLDNNIYNNPIEYQDIRRKYNKAIEELNHFIMGNHEENN
jgi:hypothetical protein